MTSRDDWRPTATLAALQRRAQLLAATRHFFDERGFIEVQTPVLSSESIVDRYIDPVATTLIVAGSPRTFYLQTSPELAMKRLIAAGATAIYQIGPVFRAGESGRLHNPEFTMLEWYRVGDSYQQGIELLGEFAAAILRVAPAEMLTYREAFQRHAGIDPFAEENAQWDLLDADRLARANELSRDDRLNWLMSEKVEPHLGWERPAIVCDWPVTQSALARVRPGEPPVAERFELFVRGLELANGYHELTDAEELRARMERAAAARKAAGADVFRGPTRLCAAIQAGMAECCGVAVGFDRLVMAAGGHPSIADVIPFPIDRA